MSVFARMTLPSLVIGRAWLPADDRGGADSLTLIDWTPGHAARSRLKRVLDLAVAGPALIVLLPVLAVVALLIRLESRGPILFRQARSGLGGAEFDCLKFRTMVADAEQRLAALESHNESTGGVLFKIRNDPRITPLGRFLRRSSLDELPQLWNVLRGQMSLVGPRPLQRRDSERLARLDADSFQQRLSVLPGITGSWQVGGRSEIDGQGMVRLDLDYIKHWSLQRDVGILVKTVGVVLRSRGAS